MHSRHISFSFLTQLLSAIDYFQLDTQAPVSFGEVPRTLKVKKHVGPKYFK